MNLIGGVRMKPTPGGWPRLSASVTYREASAMIAWLCAAFGFEIRLKIVGEGGTIEHSEITYCEAVVMVGPRAAWSQRQIWHAVTEPADRRRKHAKFAAVCR